jgi:hypothetical protein
MPSSTGVYAERNGHYQAKIVVDGTALRLGDWPTEEEAAAAYDSAARYYRGKDKGRNGTGAPPRSQEELQRRASEARARERGDTSVYRGVVDKPEKPGWTAQIGIGGWPYFLGRFPEEEQAARAADMAIRQYRPSAPTNFESDSVEGEEAKTVAQIRRWARRLHAEEGLEGFSPTSEFRGVSWHSGKERWVAQIETNCEKTYLGSYADEIEAARTYDKAALRLHDPANTNFPPSDYDVEKEEELP